MSAHPSLWLYRLLIHSVLPAAAPLLWLQARSRGKTRPAVAERMAWRLPQDVGRGGLWLQAVSVGEVEVARRLLAELRSRDADIPVLLTATTSTGLALARRTLADLAEVLPCPIDFPGPVQRVFRAWTPRAVALVETELWPELIHQSGRRNIPVAVVNARLSDDSFPRYRRFRRLLRPLLEPVSLVLARADADAERFAAIGVPAERITVVGNIKYDLEPGREPLPWQGVVHRVAADRPVVVAGSTMEGEEDLVLDAVDRLRSAQRPVFLVLAPRHPERCDGVARLLEDRGLVVIRRSRPAEACEAADVFLIDTIGELGRAYGLGTAAFVGGSLMPTGGHNPLEPAAWGVPVASGPHVHNFREVYDEMVDEGGARIVDDAAGLATVLGEWLSNPEAARAAGSGGRRVVDSNRGATARTVDELLKLIR